MRITKRYLTAMEIATIAYAMKCQESYIDKEIAKWTLIIDCSTDTEIERDEDGLIILKDTVYDEYLEKGYIAQLDEEIENICSVDWQYMDLIEKEKSESSALIKTHYENFNQLLVSANELVSNLAKNIDKTKIKDVDVGNLIKDIKGLISNDKLSKN